MGYARPGGEGGGRGPGDITAFLVFLRLFLGHSCLLTVFLRVLLEKSGTNDGKCG